MLVTPSARANARRVLEVDMFTDDDEPGDEREHGASTQHVVLTRTIDVDCPACAAAVGERCDGAFCRPRVNLAASRTREANRRARGG